MKILAMYLPQFHCTEDNNRWWGEGFTEWTAVKNAESLFSGHRQPRIPLNDNYYNLLNEPTMQWQADLMKKYHIDGLCFYHYWFKDGKRTLEKPAENLLRWKQIDMPFCFCWANESWTRTWSNLTGKNVWISAGESEEEKRNNPTGILLEQKYGDERHWKEHFIYLLPFFQDSRYIKVDGKPVFMIYKPELLTCMPQMAEKWNYWAVENGFKGIYLIGMNAFDDPTYDACLYHEPQYTIQHNFNFKFTKMDNPIGRYLDYAEVWEKILKRKVIQTSKTIYLGGFTGYDDSPRRGVGGTVVGNASPDIFCECLKELLKKSQMMGSNIVFLNAWNEWGESMYLEPDKENKYAYLEAVKEAIENYKTAEVPCIVQENTVDESVMVAKYRDFWQILHLWLLLKERNIRVAEYLHSQGISEIAIYGLGMLGLHLVKELEKGPVTIAYGVDQNAKELQMDFPVYTLNDKLAETDAVIVTVTYDYGKIYKQLRKKYSGRIFSLRQVLEEADRYDIETVCERMDK